MSFSSKKHENHTQITFENKEKKRYLVFILFLMGQIVSLGILSQFFSINIEIVKFFILATSFLIIIFSYFMVVVKTIKLQEKSLDIEYRCAGLIIWKQSYLWKNIQKIAVEFTRLKSHDILFQVDKKVIYLGESLSEEESDALLKEIQLFHHYYI